MYKMFTKLAWLNLYRRRRSSLLVILMIGSTLSIMMAFLGLYDGMMHSMSKMLLDSDTGEVSIYAKEYRLQESLDYRIKEAVTIEKALQKYEGASSVVSRITQRGMVSTARHSKLAYLIGIDIEGEDAFGAFREMLKEGEASWGRKELGAIVGVKLAKDMKLSIGSRVIFASQNIDGEIESLALRVKGIIKRDNPAIDERALYISKTKSIAFSKLEPHSRTQIALRVKNPDQVETLTQKIATDYPDLDVQNYKALMPQIIQMQDMMSVFNVIIFFIIMFVVFIGIFGVMYVSVLERLREFGILMAIGTTYAKLRFQIIVEVITLSMIGYLLGAVLGWFILKYLEIWGLDLSAFADAMQEFGMAAVMKSSIKASYFIDTFWGILVAGLVSILIPLHKLKKLNPVEVIQGD